MAFQITYIFQAVDKFTKVAKKIEKSVENIEKKVKGTNARMGDFQEKGKKSFRVVGDSIGRAEKKFNNFNRTQRKTGVLMNFLSAAVGNLRFRFASLAVSAVTSGFGFDKGLDKALNFQDALIDLEVITGATGKDLEDLKLNAISMGKAFGVSGKDVLIGMKLVGSAKAELLKNIPALKELTEQTILLATAGGVDVPQATRALVGALNIFGKGAESAGKFVNIMAAGAKFGAAEIDDIAESLIRGGGAARAAGLSFLQINVLIQALAQSGLKGARAGTALNSMLAKLEQQGIDFRASKLSEIFIKMKEEIDALPNSQQRVNAELDLFGRFHKKAGFAILTNAKRLDEWLRLMKDTNVAQEQADIRLKSLRTLFGRLGTTIEDKIFKVFERIEPVLAKLTTDFTEFIDNIDPQKIQDIADALNTVASALRLIGLFLKALIDPLTFLIGRLSLDFNLLDLDKGISKRTKKIRELIRADKPEELKLLLEKGEGLAPLETAALSPAAGRVNVDVNFKGGIGLIDSVQSTSEGNVDINTGQNLAFIG